MALTPKSFEELYQVYRDEVEARNENITDWNEGSINDILAGASSTGAQEVLRILLDRFNLTYFNGAEGDDLEYLATDHYGSSFERPEATQAVTIVTFSRPNADAGNVSIPAGTIVKTQADSSGQTQRFEVLFGVTMSGTTINASVRAITAGPDGNVGANTINQIETALTDPSIVVTNDTAASGGETEESDAAYRQTIIRLLQTLKGATKTAIQATIEEVPGVEIVTLIDFIQTVIEWDEANSLPIGDPFKIARVKAYIADANGTGNQALINNVNIELEKVRACGVEIEVLGATAFSLNWTAAIQLNTGGPNFATLQNDPQPIVDSMTKYLQDLAIGQDFNRNIARAAILAQWGPSGSNDLVDFVTSNPTGDVVTTEIQKIIPGTIGVS